MNRTASIPTTETDAPRVGARGWAALVVLMLPVLLVSVDNTVLSFALPEISIALAPTGAEQLWIIDVYPLVLAGLLVTMGTLGDRFGRRRMLLIGATGFAAVSALAAFAPTAGLLIAARALLGFFGAMLMPSTLSLLRSIFQNRDQRRLAIAVWASAFSAGSALGPIVGGFLLEHFAWGSVFLIAVPVLIPLLIAAPLLVPESRDPNPGRIDPISIVLSMAAMIPVVYAIKSLAVDGPSLVAGAWALLGIVMGCCSCAVSCGPRSPCSTWRCSAAGTFSGAILVNLLSVVALVGFLYFVSQHLQLVLGLSPMVAGLSLVPGMVAMIVAGLARRADLTSGAAAHPRAGGAGVLGRRLPDRRVHHARARCRTADHRLRRAGHRHRRGRDDLERADPLERACREGRRRERGVRDGLRAGCRARHGRARWPDHRVLPRRAGRCRPDSRPRSRDAARETLAGAYTAAEKLRVRSGPRCGMPLPTRSAPASW